MKSLLKGCMTVCVHMVTEVVLSKEDLPTKSAWKFDCTSVGTVHVSCQMAICAVHLAANVATVHYSLGSHLWKYK